MSTSADFFINLSKSLGVPVTYQNVIKGDGNCFFSSISDQFLCRPALSEGVSAANLEIFTDPLKPRKNVCTHMVDNYQHFIDFFNGDLEFHAYVNRMRIPNEWAEDHIVFATCFYVNKNIYIMSEESTRDYPFNKHYNIDQENEDNLQKCLLLGYHSQTHFQSLVLLSEKKVSHVMTVSSGERKSTLQGNNWHNVKITSAKVQSTLRDFIDPSKKRVSLLFVIS